MENFCEIYSFIESITHPETNYPKTAIRRFGRAVNNEDKNEQIVEYVLALDSLVMAERVESNMFAFILSTLLWNESNDKSNRNYVKKFMKSMYNVRNTYIHNSEHHKIKLDDKDLELEEASNEMEEYTRLSFLRYLSILKNRLDHSTDKNLKVIRSNIHKDLLNAILDQDKLKELQRLWGQFSLDNTVDV